MLEKNGLYCDTENEKAITLIIDRYNVTASFAKQKNKDAYNKVRQILLSSYANKAIAHACNKLDTRATI